MSTLTRRDILSLLLSLPFAQAAAAHSALLAPVGIQQPDALWEAVAKELLPEVAAEGHWIFDTGGGISAAASGFKYLYETRSWR